MMEPHVQQWSTVQAATQGALSVAEVWMNHISMGGMCDELEVAGYLHGLLLVDGLQRDMIAHAVNELLDDLASPARRAAYSTDVVSKASGYPETAFNTLGCCTDEQITRFTSEARGLMNPEEYEARRLDSLHQTGLFGSANEERFDQITRQATELFHVSSSSIALIGKDRQFIKSLSGPIGQNVPRAISFCNETIRADGCMVVTDALHDDRFSHNPLVLELPHIRFYAGFPLVGPGGWRIGTLCIIDDKPRAFTERDEQVLLGLARQAQKEVAT